MITLKQVCNLMEKINDSWIYESFFEGKGNGEVILVCQDKFYTIGYYNGKTN
jgi:hypothetical protein